LAAVRALERGCVGAAVRDVFAELRADHLVALVTPAATPCHLAGESLLSVFNAHIYS
jgi:hypothetical protein